jgi:ferredoxin
MTWVITRLCRDCLDTSCIEVCPVDCIYKYVGAASDQLPIQLYIDPDECIDCQACEPVCPGRRHCATPRYPQCSTTTSF